MVRESKTGRYWDCLLGHFDEIGDLPGDVCAGFTREISASAGDRFRVERSGNAVLVIGEGVVKSARDLADGRVAVTGFHYPGDLVEVPAAIGRETVFEAVTDCRVCEINLKEARRLIPAPEGLLDTVGRHAMTRISADEIRILGLAHASAAERVAGFLESLASRPGARRADPRVVWTPMRRDDIANYLGMQPETLSRTYAELARTGVIAVRSRSQVELLGDR